MSITTNTRGQQVKADQRYIAGMDTIKAYENEIDRLHEQMKATQEAKHAAVEALSVIADTINDELENKEQSNV